MRPQSNLRTSKRRPSTRFQSRFERLESRDLMAVNVAMNYLSLTMSLKGDAANDQVLINSTYSPNGAVYDITGVGGTVITTTDPYADSIAGGVRIYYVKNIKADLGAGNDVLSFNRVNAYDVSVIGGEGNDTVNIGTAAADHAFYNLSFDGGAGNDLFRLHNGFNRVVNLLSIKGGDGDNTVELGAESTDKTELGALSIVNANGRDELTVRGQSLFVTKAVTIDNGTNANSGTFGSATHFLTTQNLSIGGATTIKNGHGRDTLQFGTGGVGSVNMLGLTMTNDTSTSYSGPGVLTHGSSVILAAGRHTLGGNVSIATKTGSADFSVLGFDFVLTGTLTLGSNKANVPGNVQLIPTNSLHITGKTTFDFASFGDSNVSIGTGGTTDVSMGGMTVLPKIHNAETNVALNGGGHTFLGDVTLNKTDFVASGQRTTITGKTKVGGSSSFNSVSTSFTGDVELVGNTLLSSSSETNFRGASFKTGGNVTISGGRAFFNGKTGSTKVTMNGGTVIMNSPVAVSGSLLIAGSLIDFNSTLDIFKDLTLTGSNIRFDGPTSGIAGNLSIKGTTSNDSLVGRNVHILGNITVDMGEGTDLLQVDDSNCFGKTSVKMGGGDDTVLLETLNTNQLSDFFGSVILDMGAGADVLTIGRASDTNDYCTFAFRVTADGGTQFVGTSDVINVQTAFNEFYFDPTVINFETRL